MKPPVNFLQLEGSINLLLQKFDNEYSRFVPCKVAVLHHWHLRSLDQAVCHSYSTCLGVKEPSKREGKYEI